MAGHAIHPRSRSSRPRVRALWHERRWVRHFRSRYHRCPRLVAYPDSRAINTVVPQSNGRARSVGMAPDIALSSLSRLLNRTEQARNREPSGIPRLSRRRLVGAPRRDVKFKRHGQPLVEAPHVRGEDLTCPAQQLVEALRPTQATGLSARPTLKFVAGHHEG